MHTNGQATAAARRAPTSGRAARASRRLAEARLAVRDLRVDAKTLLKLRGERLADTVRRYAWTAVGLLLLAFVGCVVLGTATVLLLVGAAGALAELMGTGTAIGALIVGGAALVSTGSLVALQRRGRLRDEAEGAERRLHRAMKDSSRRLVGSIGKGPLAVLVGVGSLLSIGLLRDRRVRRFVVSAAGALRTARRVASRAVG